MIHTFAQDKVTLSVDLEVLTDRERIFWRHLVRRINDTINDEHLPEVGPAEAIGRLISAAVLAGQLGMLRFLDEPVSDIVLAGIAEQVGEPLTYGVKDR